MSRSNIIILIIVLAGAAVIAIAAGVKHNSGNDQYAQSQNTNQPTATPTAGPTAVPSITPTLAAVAGCPNGKNVTQTDSLGKFKPTMDIANKTVTLNTSMGAITIQLYDKDAPKTVENFLCLAKAGYYNGVTFHRVAHDFVIQSGDPTGTGAGGQSIYGQAFEDELYPTTASYKAGYLKGVVAMANAGANTNGSQFFILLSNHPELSHAYTIFGKVIAGQDVVDKIGALAVTDVNGPGDGTPNTKVTITTATVK